MRMFIRHVSSGSTSLALLASDSPADGGPLQEAGLERLIGDDFGRRSWVGGGRWRHRRTLPRSALRSTRA
jgi:hypothetical protein